MVRLSEAIDTFSKYREMKFKDVTVVRYDRVLRIFCLCMHDPEIEDIKLTQVLDHLAEMQKLGWKRNGLNIVALSLRKLFEFYALQGHKVVPPELIPLPRKEVNIPRVACEESYKKLLGAIPTDTNHPNHIRNAALISLTWDSGARIGEVLSLDITDPDTERRSALIKTEKSRGRRPLREIFWTEETNERLKRWTEKRKELAGMYTFKDPDALFVTLQTTTQSKERGRRMTNRAAAEVFRMISNQAGLPLVNAHSMRHAMGRDIVKKGGSNADVANILGHSNPDSSMIYTMMFGEDLHERWELYRGDV